MKSDYFDYKVPFWREIKSAHPYPYRFSEELQAQVDLIMRSPRHKWGILYAEQRWLSDRNEMLQVIYSYVMYARDNMSTIGGAVDNIVPQITVTMWKKFLGVHKRYKRGLVPTQYYPTHVKHLRSGVALLVEEVDKAVRSGDFVVDSADMCKARRDVSARGRKLATQEGSKAFEFYADSK